MNGNRIFILIRVPATVSLINLEDVYNLCPHHRQLVSIKASSGATFDFPPLFRRGFSGPAIQFHSIQFNSIQSHFLAFDLSFNLTPVGHSFMAANSPTPTQINIKEHANVKIKFDSRLKICARKSQIKLDLERKPG